VIFFPAAEPNVDRCETHPDEARRSNLDPLAGTLRAAGGTRILGFSSDYVFDGTDGPYAEDARPHPISVYGRIKLELESRLLELGHTVIRTTTVFGREEPPPKNFVLRLVASLGDGSVVRVPSDQISTPTYAEDLARAAVRIAQGGSGVWHVAGPDLVGRAELAFRVAAVFGLPTQGIRPVPTLELQQAAARPLRGGLLCQRFEVAFGPAGRPLEDALEDLRDRLVS